MEQGNNESSLSGEIYAIRLEKSNEYRYVGQTFRGAALRFKEHIARSKSKNTPLNCWIIKHIDDIIVFDILETNIATLQELNQYEVQWIKTLKEHDHRLLNLTEGGDGTLGYSWSPEKREQMSARLLGEKHHNYGKKWSEETRRKMSEAHKGRTSPNKGKTTSEETKAKIRASMPDRSGSSNPMYGSKMPEDHKERLRRLSSRPRTEEEKAKMSAAQKGKPNRGGHVRFHIRNETYKTTCTFCVEEGLVN